MVKKLICGGIIAAACGIFSSCEQEDIINTPGRVPGENIPVKSTYLSLKTEIEDVAKSRAVQVQFQKGDVMGIFVDDTCKNKPFTFDGNIWGGSNILLHENNSNIKAYYPYNDKVIGEMIPINIQEQKDVLFGRGLASTNNACVAMTMKHTMTLVKVVIKKNTYKGEGRVSSITIKGVAMTGTLNLADAVISNGQIGEYAAGGNYLLNDDNSIVVESILLPTKNSEGIQFTIVMDGKIFDYLVPVSHSWEAGKEYLYTLKMKAGYNAAIDLEDVPYDVNYWSRYGKEDKIVLRDCGMDFFTIGSNLIRYGNDVYRNEGRLFAILGFSLCSDLFIGEWRLVFMNGNTIVEQFPPLPLTAKPGQLLIETWQRCFVTAAAGRYELVPLFRRQGETTWFKAIQYYNEQITKADMMWTVKEQTTLPALRMINLENKDNGCLIYTAPINKIFNVVYILSNKEKRNLRGTIKAVWERTFGDNSYCWRKGSKAIGGIDDYEWEDEIGRVEVNINSDIRYWQGIIHCKFPVVRKPPRKANRQIYAGAMVHLYWKAEGSNDWVFLRCDGEPLFVNKDGFHDDISLNYLDLGQEGWID